MVRRFHPVAWAMLSVLGAGCTTLATVEGARTLEPGVKQFTVPVSVQQGSGSLTNAGMPLPTFEFAMRAGVAEDVDVGLRLYLLGLGGDVRYRFYHRGPLHVAITPGLYGLWVPSGKAGQGSLEVRAPLTAEYELSRSFSVAGGPRVILRDQWNSIADPDLGSGAAGRLDVFSGAGARFEFHRPRFVWGIGTDLYAQPARRGGFAWSLGMDIGWRTKQRRGKVKQ